MHLTVLAVPGCPNAPVLDDRLAIVLGGRAGVSMSHQVISDEDEAARWRMHGSPTLLIDGVDPFAELGGGRRRTMLPRSDMPKPWQPASLLGFGTKRLMPAWRTASFSRSELRIRRLAARGRRRRAGRPKGSGRRSAAAGSRSRRCGRAVRRCSAGRTRRRGAGSGWNTVTCPR